jgi:opacity protein-like surface antigen
VNLQGGAGVNNYPSKQTLNGETKWRDDTFYSYGVGAEYAFREWLTVGAEYLHGARRSNFDTFNFSQDKFIGRVTLHF